MKAERFITCMGLHVIGEIGIVFVPQGCSGGDYRSVGKTMALTDHLSERTKYGPYLNYKDKTTR